MRVLFTAIAALLIAGTGASAQGMPSSMATLPGPQVTPGAVMRVNLYRIKVGMSDAYWSDVRTHLAPIYEEYKKRGLVTDYTWFQKLTAESENDWDVGFTISFANWAALDNFAAKNTDPVTLAHYGSVTSRTAAAAARTANRDVVQSFLVRGLSPNPVPSAR